MSFVRTYLDMLVQTGSLAGGFFRHLGQPFEPTTSAPAGERGPARQCFFNAGELAIQDSSFGYCEGYARTKNGVPVLHAWCVNADGRAVDPTWAWDPGNEYWGVAIQTEALMTHLEKTQTWGMFAEMVPPRAVEKPLRYLDARWPPSPEGLASLAAMLKAADLGPARKRIRST